MSDYISHDNFSDILKWLPVKTLLRFRSVCRGWKEIIDSPSFVQDHLSMQKNPQILVKYEEPELLVLNPDTLPLFDTLSLPLSFLETLSDPIEDHEIELFRLVGTLDGVICLYNNIRFQLWNPSIRKFSTLPLAGEFELEDDFESSYFGFWIDSSGKNFKIIVFELTYDDVENELVEGNIYSSIKQAWVPLPVFKLNDYIYKAFPEGPPVMIDGVAHWRANTEWIDDEGEEEKEYLGTIILSFDFEDESFDVIELPHATNYNDQFTPVHCNLLDSLAVVYWGLEEGARCDVYVYEGEWINVFAFDLSLAPIYRVLWVTGETEETCRVLAETREELVIYDAVDICSCTDVKRGLRNSENMFVAHDFVESLVFPDM